VVLDLVLPERAFLYRSSIATVSLITTWTMILVTPWLFRKAKLRDGTSAGLRFPLFGWPFITLCRAGRHGAGGGDDGVPIDEPA
jgi:L-asparagine transporter-like permease